MHFSKAFILFATLIILACISLLLLSSLEQIAIELKLLKYDLMELSLRGS